MDIFRKKHAKFTAEELELLRGRIEVELEWGLQCYSQKQVDLMNSIMSKIKKQLS